MRWCGVAIVVLVVCLGALGCKRSRTKVAATPSPGGEWLNLTVSADRTRYAYEAAGSVVLHSEAGDRKVRVGTGCLLESAELHIIAPQKVLALKQVVHGDPLDQHPERGEAAPCLVDFETLTARPAQEVPAGLRAGSDAFVVLGGSGELHVQPSGRCDLVETASEVVSACFERVEVDTDRERTVLEVRRSTRGAPPSTPPTVLHSELPEGRTDVEARLSRDGNLVSVFGHIGKPGPEPDQDSFLQVRDSVTGALRFEQHERGRTPSFIDVDFAPDGAALVALMQVNDSEGGSYRGEIWLQRYDLTGKATRLPTAAPVQSYRVRWLADGQLMCERGPCPK